MARGLKFWIREVEVLYYPSSENKGADQLFGYREADLPLCFHICKNVGFSHDTAQMSFNALVNQLFARGTRRVFFFFFFFLFFL